MSFPGFVWFFDSIARSRSRPIAGHKADRTTLAQKRNIFHQGSGGPRSESRRIAQIVDLEPQVAAHLSPEDAATLLGLLARLNVW